MLRWLAKRILKKELAKLKKYEDNDRKHIYIDEDSPDELVRLREMLEWSENINARRYAFERLNSLLVDNVRVSNDNSQDFYVIQGAMAEMNKFMKMSDNIGDKIDEVLAARKALTDPEPEDESMSISEINR